MMKELGERDFHGWVPRLLRAGFLNGAFETSIRFAMKMMEG